MSDRNQDIVERISRAEKDLLQFKTAQLFGKDVTTPKVIQRYNSDGTPTEWDVMGTYDANAQRYNIGGQITYTANTQNSPWATVYAEIKINPSGEIISESSAGFNAYASFDDLFSGGKTIKFDVYGAASEFYGPPSDPTIDRYWVKIYVLATDYGQLQFNFPFGANGAGYVVAQT